MDKKNKVGMNGGLIWENGRQKRWDRDVDERGESDEECRDGMNEGKKEGCLKWGNGKERNRLGFGEDILAESALVQECFIFDLCIGILHLSTKNK